MREVPLRGLAEELGLPIHERDTFTSWNMPKPDGVPINLIIAVSFGLFVPRRLIHSAKYGGLNVHPSLLPDLRGPAPIHHALLAERDYTGITIQTLSTEAFDAGVPLLQTPHPGIPIPIGCTPEQLHETLAPLGAQLLLQALRAGLHVPPYEPYQQPPTSPIHHRHDTTTSITTETPYTPPAPTHAPKITPQDRQILWASQTAREVAVRHRVLGPLWTHVRQAGGNHEGIKSSNSSSSSRRRSGKEVEEEEKPSSSEKRAILEDVSVAGPPVQTAAASADVSGSVGASVGGDAGCAAREAEAGGAAAWEESDGDGTVTWIQKTPLPQTTEGKKSGVAPRMDSKSVTLRYWMDMDGKGVIVRMAQGSWLRVGKIKVEGSTFKPARHVLGGKRFK
ncbi:formyl transferase [Corynascus novoguineensis]|uniref:Formyl transferase n=1 Tax=Corynascus novoguineensis TaxID=1126955 RepID=A0AAN7D120_9PEZI|nr:formyl transferase [Corynascus novoguineensis]